MQMQIGAVRVGLTRKGKGDHVRYEGGTGAGGYWLRLIIPKADCEGVGQVNVSFALNGATPAPVATRKGRQAAAAPATVPQGMDPEVYRMAQAIVAAQKEKVQG